MILPTVGFQTVGFPTSKFPCGKTSVLSGCHQLFWGISDIIWFTFYNLIYLLSWWSTFFLGFIWFHQFHPHPTFFFCGAFVGSPPWHGPAMRMASVAPSRPRSAVPLRSESQGLSQRRADPSADAAEEHRGTASGSWWVFFWGGLFDGLCYVIWYSVQTWGYMVYWLNYVEGFLRRMMVILKIV